MAQKQLLKIIKHDRADTDERLNALRLQTRAWRIMTMIALVEPETARTTAQWLLFNTVPFVNGPTIEKFIAENEVRAEECGIKAGVFTARKVAP